MTVLIDGFSIVARLEALDAKYPGGFEAYWDELPNDSGCYDDHLVRVGFATRPEFRGWLETLAGRGLPDAAALLEATERTPGRILPAAEVAARQARMATTTGLALVFRLKTVRPAWLEVGEGRFPGTQVVVGGASLAGAPPIGLAVPDGWTVERAVPERYEPEPGDELLPTWHELLAESSAETRAEMLRWGPDGYLSFSMQLGGPKPFGGRVHPGGLVIEEERTVRDPDGTEHVVVHRWTKLPQFSE